MTTYIHKMPRRDASAKATALAALQIRGQIQDAARALAPGRTRQAGDAKLRRLMRQDPAFAAAVAQATAKDPREARFVRFLAELRLHGCAERAAAAASPKSTAALPSMSAFRHRRRTDPLFALAWAVAVAEGKAKNSNRIPV